jgi:hypothetical protein
MGEADFVHFYRMAAVAADGHYAALYSDAALHAEQVRRVPLSGSAHYPPVYGPQVAVALSPLARLSYLEAYGVLALFTVLATFASIASFRTWMPRVAAWPAPLAAALAAFLPLAYAVFAGQISAVALLAAALTVAGLGRGSRVWAGVGIGLVAYKVSLFGPALALCVLSGEWTIASVAAGLAGLQIACVAPIVGAEVAWRYLENSLSILRHADNLAAKPQYMASLRTFWAALVPAGPAWMVYFVTAAVALGLAAWAWRRTTDPLQRVGVLTLAVVLASPHLYFYDLLFVIPAFLASADWLLQHPSPGLRWCVYLAFLAPLAAPLMPYTHIQPVTVVLAAWLIAFARVLGTREIANKPDLVTRSTATSH